MSLGEEVQFVVCRHVSCEKVLEDEVDFKLDHVVPLMLLNERKDDRDDLFFSHVVGNRSLLEAHDGLKKLNSAQLVFPKRYGTARAKLVLDRIHCGLVKNLLNWLDHFI